MQPKTLGLLTALVATSVLAFAPAASAATIGCASFSSYSDSHTASAGWSNDGAITNTVHVSALGNGEAVTESCFVGVPAGHCVAGKTCVETEVLLDRAQSRAC